MKEIIEILVVLVTGPLVGVEFGVTAFTHPLLERLPDAAYRQGRSESSRVLGKVMPIWYGAALLLQIVAAVLRPEPLFIAAAVLMVLVMVLTLTLLVPLNNRISAWSSTTEVSRGDARRWDTLHWVRVAVLVGLFVLLVVACVR